MIVIRFAVSNPLKTVERERFHQSHKEYIRSAPFEVISSGPAFQEGDAATAAALLVARVESLSELQAFNARDPFVENGVYSQTWLLEWQPSMGVPQKQSLISMNES